MKENIYSEGQGQVGIIDRLFIIDKKYWPAKQMLLQIKHLGY